MKKVGIFELEGTAENRIPIRQFPGQHGRVFVGFQFLTREYSLFDFPFSLIRRPLFTERFVVEGIGLARLSDSHSKTIRQKRGILLLCLFHSQA
tara:strand:- start:654 stop:935 length:282 start_codon:yes stop_codon:yes gene_type:complete